MTVLAIVAVVVGVVVTVGVVVALIRNDAEAFAYAIALTAVLAAAAWGLSYLTAGAS